MKLTIAVLAVLAIIGSAMAWDINEELEYTYTKSTFEQAGAGLTASQLADVKSGAYFYEPNGAYGDEAAKVTNKLESITIDRVDELRGANLENANFYSTLTQGGSAAMTTRAMDGIDNSVLEISGDASAYQNLWVGGGFQQVAAEFDSKAMVGTFGTSAPTYNFVVTDTDNAKASVNSEIDGASEFMKANLGAQVTADVEQQWAGSGWLDPTYSGGLTMWASFSGACDPGCVNPIISSVSGSAATALFPRDTSLIPSPYGPGESFYWGDNWNTLDDDGFNMAEYTGASGNFVNTANDHTWG